MNVSSERNTVTQKRCPGLFALAAVAAVCPADARSESFVSNSTAAVVTWRGTAIVLGFDEYPGLAPSSGTPVNLPNQVATQYRDIGLLLSTTGGPCGVVNIPPDAFSDPNLLSGTVLAGAGQVVLNFAQPINVRFVLPDTDDDGATTLVGAWNDPTGARIRLEVFDAEGAVLESVEADQGWFLGIKRPGIVRARFSFVQAQAFPGFTIDDLTFNPPGPIRNGDCNNDHVVDLLDYGPSPACMTGPDVGAAPACACHDIDADGDVDLSDIRWVQLLFTGP
jgi:hypothetical protein